MNVTKFKDTIKNGTKITIFLINALAMTSRVEATVLGQDAKGYYGKLKGKRKLIYLFPHAQEHIVFKGWNTPVKADSDTNKFMGNACFNFVAESQEFLKEFLENSLNGLTNFHKSHINFVEIKGQFEDNIYHELFPII